MGKKWQKYITYKRACLGLLVLSALLLCREIGNSQKVTEVSNLSVGVNPLGKGMEENSKKPVIVVDPGHGGKDPGKIGWACGKEVLEKDINLAIAFSVKAYLELNDVEVYLTREKDEMLGGEENGSKKAADMRARIRLLEEIDPDAVISIHQNSFPRESVKGAQAFYYEGSGPGKSLAASLQEAIKRLTDPDNQRQIRPNKEYYMLKNSKAPLAIVECGFLSNPGECERLATESYQDRMAWSIAMGLLQYLRKEDRPVIHTNG